MIVLGDTMLTSSKILSTSKPVGKYHLQHGTNGHPGSGVGMGPASYGGMRGLFIEGPV